MSDNTRQKPARITGIKHLFAALTYSIGGVRRLLAEAAFRHEVLGGAIVLGLLWVTDASAAEFLIFGLLFLLLVAVEALNTAIECIIDHLSPNWSEFARDTKDLGSLAVFCLLGANALFLAYVFFT
ncbi:MAG: diacylglycerol kinase [Paracoccaceae bacterium]